MQRPNAHGEYVWEELDLLLDDQGAPIPGTDQQGAALPQNPWSDAQRVAAGQVGGPPMMAGMGAHDHHAHHHHHHHAQQQLGPMSHHQLPHQHQHMAPHMAPHESSLAHGGHPGVQHGSNGQLYPGNFGGQNSYGPHVSMAGRSVPATLNYQHQHHLGAGIGAPNAATGLGPAPHLARGGSNAAGLANDGRHLVDPPPTYLGPDIAMGSRGPDALVTESKTSSSSSSSASAGPGRQQAARGGSQRGGGRGAARGRRGNAAAGAAASATAAPATAAAPKTGARSKRGGRGGAAASAAAASAGGVGNARGTPAASAPSPPGVAPSMSPGSASSSVGPTAQASPPATKSSAKSESKNQAVDKDAKRRAAVAAASRATRAKRKRELEELKEKNVKLEKERETFLNTIADLQMKVQALRETGSIDLRMENDLLRAELMEHKSFISKFKHIADGIPTTTSAKKLMCKQGSDTAIAQVLGLLSTSMADPSWRIGTIKYHPEIEMRYQRLPHGVSAENAKRCSVRVDVPVIPVKDPIEVAQIVWGVWCDEDLNKRISKHFGAVSVSVREIETGIENGKNEAKDSLAGESLRNRVKVYYYREETPRHDLEAASGEGKATDVVDTVLLLSSREKSISRSSFPPDMRFHKFPPDAETERARLQGKIKPAQPFTLEQQQGLEGQKNYNAIVLASTSTQHSLGLVPVKRGVHRIRSALLEGSVFRKVEGGVAMSSVFSYPSSAEGRIKAHHDVLVSDDGTLNEQWAKVICEMHDIVLERLPPTIFDAYRKARAQGVPFPKEVENLL